MIITVECFTLEGVLIGTRKFTNDEYRAELCIYRWRRLGFAPSVRWQDI